MTVRKAGRALFLALFVCLLAGYGMATTQAALAPPAEPNDLRWDLAEKFEFRWTSAELSAKVVNGASSSLVERTLIISGVLGILDDEGVVSIDVNDPAIIEVLDRDGNAVQYQANQSSSARCYQGLGWRSSLEGGKLIPQYWHPFTLTLRLSDDPNQPVPSSLTLLKGYVYVLYADDVISFDVPFDPNSGCHEMETAPDLQVCVDSETPPCPAEPLGYIRVAPELGRLSPVRSTTPVPLYKYTTWVKSKSGRPVMALQDPSWWPRDLYPLGDYVVLGTKLFTYADGKSWIRSFSTQWTRSGAAGSQGACCWGYVEQMINDNMYDTIRHVIAVHPVEIKIPFALKDIPIPSVQQAPR